MGDDHTSIGDEAVHAVAADREGIGLSGPDAPVEHGDPNKDGGETTRRVVPEPTNDPSAVEDDAEEKPKKKAKGDNGDE